jgi:hypothetical protein
MVEGALDGQQEIPRRVVLEIGADSENSYLKQYRVSLPPETIHQTINVRYGLLPNEASAESVLPMEDESVDEVVISNVLSDLVYIPHTETDRTDAFWEYYLQRNPGKPDLDTALEHVASFQKMRTVQDILRVLKTNGVLKIYENYRQFHPSVVEQILEWLKANPNLEFSEDIEEEQRLKPMFDAENAEKIKANERNKLPCYGNEPPDLPRPLNKVYIVVKKPPE